MTALRELHKVLEEISKNTARPPPPTPTEALEDAVHAQAAKLPPSLLLSVPAVFAGAVPLFFEFGSEVAPAHIAAIAGTFFVVFFILPILLLVFRAYGVSYSRFFVFALTFACGAGAVQWVPGTPERAVASCLFAFVFGLGPHLLISGVVHRWLARPRRASPVLNAAENGGTPEAVRGARSMFVAFAGIDRRREPRHPSIALGLLSGVAAVGIVALSNAPAHQADLATRPLLALLPASASAREVNEDLFGLIPIVNGAKSRSNAVKRLRERDYDALAFMPGKPAAWDSALHHRDSLHRQGSELFRLVALLQPGTAGAFAERWKSDSERWVRILDNIDARRKSAVAGYRPGRDGDPVADSVHAMADRLREELRTRTDGDLLALANGAWVKGAPSLTRLDSLEQLGAVLRAGPAGRRAALLAADDGLITQQSIFFAELNGFVQKHLAQTMNNARVVGLGVFGAALAVLAGTLAMSSFKRLPGPSLAGVERVSVRLRFFRREEGRRRGTYVLGCALLVVFATPLLKEIMPERLDPSRPFTPFTLPTWYLPALASETAGGGGILGAGVPRDGRRADPTDPEPGDVTKVTDPLPPPPDTVYAMQPIDMAVLESMVARAAREAVDNSRDTLVVQVGTRIDSSRVAVLREVDSLKRHLYEKRAP